MVKYYTNNIFYTNTMISIRDENTPRARQRHLRGIIPMSHYQSTQEA
jgi:hypothetical protein